MSLLRALGLAYAGASLVFSAAASAGSAATAAELAPLQPGLDYHSFANVEQFRVTRLELDLDVDSHNKILSGTVGLQVARLDPRATELVLDTRDLAVQGVSQKAQDVLGAMSKSETTWISRPFHLEKKDPVLGSALVIELPPSKKPQEFIRIEYETVPEAPALHWLSARQTRHKPFFYTSSEPLGARSWIPLQDTPQVRMTYKAVIHTDRDVRAVMSAVNDPKAGHGGKYAFDMPQAVPAYLIALAVGDFEFKETGPRTGIYAQKSLIKAAQAEFADTEAMLTAAERLAGPYHWDRYDILVMPPAFPVGGMANPRLGFISSTVIAGDKSLVGVAADAIGHAWSGNLVGIATWRDRWLNDGFSCYLGSRIMSAVYGERRGLMDRALDVASFKVQFAALKPADRVLAMDLRDRDPATVDREVPCEKGRLFLEFLEARFGRERFDAFLHAYLDHFALKTLTTEQFQEYLKTDLLDRYPGTVSVAEVSAWLIGSDLPSDAVLPETDAFAVTDAVRADFVSGRVAAKKLDTHAWVAQQWLYFLDHLPALGNAQLAALDEAFGLSRSTNDEIEQRWLMLVIRNHYQPGYTRLEDYLATIGRNRLIVPLYREMMQTPAGATQARRVYKKVRLDYAAETVAVLDPLIDLDSDSSDDADEQ